MRSGRQQVQEILANSTTRRRFLAGTGALVGLLSWQQAEIARAAAGRLGASPPLDTDPFTLGVASGEPGAGRVVLWTRLAPDPGSGQLASPDRLRVDWEVYRDPELRRVTRSGSAWARPEDAHAVHVDVGDLQPGRPYWYRFRAGSFLSPVGRTQTFPGPGERLAGLRFGFCSCSDWQNGEFAAYARMAEEELDVVLQLGDYLYEYGPDLSTYPGRRHTTPAAGPGASQLTTLGDYRARHAQYKTDPALQALHASAPWLVVPDDHEVENNYANDVDEEPGTDPATFLLQRAAAFKAYWEHMPLRRRAEPDGPDIQLYRRSRFGDLLDVHLLDTRQYRTDQPVDLSTPVGQALAAMDFRPSLPADGNPAGTLLGDEQEEWLLEGLRRSRARWNALGQQVMMARFNFGSFIPAEQGGPTIYNVDQWDGYGAERQRLLDAVAAEDGLDLVVLTGDIHSAWVHDLKASFDDPGSRTVATEFVTTSISSDFPPQFWQPVEAAATFTSPWTRYLDARRRGYVVCTVERDTWRTDFRAVESSPDRGQVVSTTAPVVDTDSFVVERGRPGAVRA
jgi:alkaline phosphatase D